ncbi:hypothetical protein [Bradyrhizobium sp.]|uniref:hypothetical protein n=1 Tax=Bradyrhizobium sp. TaxID=376 RepID=UPI002CD7DCF3|nr:hypothetical protein [Bradyrhizobium sp.]HWX58274.1 hypothetical protein [Bradyrhizobium sp.]
MAEAKVLHPVSDQADPARGTLDAHRLLVMWLFICTLSAGIPFLVLVLYFDKTARGGVTIMIPVMAAGAGGAFVSSLRRLYGFEDIFPRRSYIRLFRKLDFYVIAYSLVPVLVGIIGAVMLYLLFARGLLKGDLFPDFICATNQSCDDFHGFVANWVPKDAAANAKAIVWGFVAGFSERFVSNILNHFATDKER